MVVAMRGEKGHAIECLFGHLHRILTVVASRAFSVLMGIALVCTLAVKLFHAWRYDMIAQYVPWILSDVAVLAGVEVLMALAFFALPKRPIFRLNTIIATLLCLWSIVNAAWLIRTGTQIFPQAILPLIRDPLNVSLIVAINLIKNPIGFIALLIPCLFSTALVVMAIVRPTLPIYHKRPFLVRVVATALIATAAVPARATMIKRFPSGPGASEMHYNSQLRAIVSLFRGGNGLTRQDLLSATRQVPGPTQVWLDRSPEARSSNVLIVIFEGLAYRYTSLAQPELGTTPFLTELASRGVEFTSMRSTITHTTKAIFAILTGRYPSASQDVVEAIPNPDGYASLATILAGQAGYRTAFFQSARGTFESRPSLVANLGFGHFAAREQLVSTDAYLGYLGADEFGMLPKIRSWLVSDDRPFLLVIMCSATHDPYEVPVWFGPRPGDSVSKYMQTVRYTDAFLKALDQQLSDLGLRERTIFCVVGDHGEAFGEHGRLGHDLMGFDEAMHVPWLIAGPIDVRAGSKVTQPTSSIDVCPTILGQLGFRTAGLDGADCIHAIPTQRPVYFSCWANDGPAGFVLGTKKYIYDGFSDQATVFDLSIDPQEQSPLVLPGIQAELIKAQVLSWRRSTLLMVPQMARRMVLYNDWLCKPVARDCTCRYRPNS